MMKSPLLKLVVKAVWLITAIASIHIGTQMWGFDLFSLRFIEPYAVYLKYLFAASGVVSLLMFFMRCCGCGNESYSG